MHPRGAPSLTFDYPRPYTPRLFSSSSIEHDPLLCPNGQTDRNL